MKSWIVGILVIFAMVAAIWSISTVMGNVYAPNASPTNEDCRESSGIDAIAESAEAGCACCGTSEGSAAPEEAASAYYYDLTGDDDFQVEIEDFGCHYEAKILKDGIIVMELRIEGGQVTEI